MTDTSASWRGWTAVITLGVGSFAIVTTELAPIGLLTNIGKDLRVSDSAIGLIVTFYAWIGAAAALLSATIVSHLPRRPLLFALMAILALSAVASGAADQFGALMGGRIIGAIAHGAFWAMIGTLGAQLVPPRFIGAATSIIFGGVSAASVLGVPLANFIGQSHGWRAAFYVIAALALVVSAATLVTLPSLPGRRGVNLATLGRIIADHRFQKIFGITAIAITAHFMAFTYVEPFLRDRLEVSASWIFVLLFVFGLSGLGANFIAGALIDRHLKSLLVVSLMLAAMALIAMTAPVVGDSLPVLAILLIVWGGSVSIIFVGLQTWILKAAGEDALPASAIYVALFNAAIGLGALLGSAILRHASVEHLFLLAGVGIATSVPIVSLLRRPGEITVAV